MRKIVRPPCGFPWENQPGFFTELMRENAWPPGFVSQTAKAAGVLSSVEVSRIASVARAAQLAKGYTGSIKGISKKSDARLQQTADAVISKARRA